MARSKIKIRENDFNSANLFIKIMKADNLGDLAMKVPFHIKKVVTSRWTMNGCPMDIVGLKRFCVDVLKNETGFMQDTGCVVVLKKPRKSRRKTPETHMKRLDGRMAVRIGELRRFMVFYDSENREICNMPFCTRKVAGMKIKELFKAGKIPPGEIFCYVEYRADDRKPVFKMDLHSKEEDPGTEQGEYIAFGIVAMDYNG